MNHDRRTLLRALGAAGIGAGAFAGNAAADDGGTESDGGGPGESDGGGASESGGSGAGSYFDPSDGFADAAPWLDDDTPVYRVTEPTREAFEEAVNRSGPRVVVFETSGTVDLGAERLTIEEDGLYLAGQTAPSPGVTLIRGGVWVDANDCLLRHVRVRPGDAGQEEGWIPDGIRTADGTENNVIDHCSITWAVDENGSPGYDSVDTTYSNCIMAEGLADSTHPKGTHSYGTLVGDGSTGVALLGNVWAHNIGRNPRLKAETASAVVNNVMYHYDEATNVDDSTVASIVANSYLRVDDGDYNIEGGSAEAYIADNVTDPETPMVGPDLIQVDEPPVWPEGLEPLSAEAAEDHALAYAGARPADRTANDRRVISDVRTFGGEWIDSQEAVGGYPDLAVNTRSLDVPESGLAEWLESHAVRVEQAQVEYYQVDFLGGEPIEELGEDGLYADQDRLMRFARGTPADGIVDRGSAWASAELRNCLDYGHIVSHDDGASAHVHFTVADDCEGVVLSLAVHSAPTDEFSVDTVDQQELLSATTGTYGPGDHSIRVDLPSEH
ncbi:pectate lyase family protein [Candidatus Halobonum tyrrellensis]|uniref:Pectate lyase n=1 Tax=Candidatus Halobonum tyrrellensis G22 TaxID=1324957 RepID=V4HGP3_9EURY|nr:hypothetical protein [Candidatus Halobonum tyrrellensis]ESP86979.1 hypothetical protein K933_15707 [Candidatus Halobonum tyrrellensis G22]